MFLRPCEYFMIVSSVDDSCMPSQVSCFVQVTTVEKVLTYGGTSVPSWAFSEQLRQFNGIVAVGTEGAYVYLLGESLGCRCEHQLRTKDW